MNNLDIINVDTKDLRTKSSAAQKIADDYSKLLKELYDCFSKLKESEVIIGSGNVDAFINSIKSDLVMYNKLSSEIKKHFDAVNDYADDIDGFVRRVDNDKIIL